jgi:hypothetical protein
MLAERYNVFTEGFDLPNLKERPGGRTGRLYCRAR